jgi:hypothetical protein
MPYQANQKNNLFQSSDAFSVTVDISNCIPRRYEVENSSYKKTFRSSALHVLKNKTVYSVRPIQTVEVE